MKILAVTLAVSAALATSACQTTKEAINAKEDLLVASGFTMLPANTPKRQATLAQLPPNKFVPRTKGDTTTYVYADPVACNCLYIGNQTALAAYKEHVFAQKIADQQQMTAEMYQDNWDWGVWDWGPWGGGWWR